MTSNENAQLKVCAMQSIKGKQSIIRKVYNQQDTMK